MRASELHPLRANSRRGLGSVRVPRPRLPWPFESVPSTSDLETWLGSLGDQVKALPALSAQQWQHTTVYFLAGGAVMSHNGRRTTSVYKGKQGVQRIRVSTPSRFSQVALVGQHHEPTSEWKVCVGLLSADSADMTVNLRAKLYWGVRDRADYGFFAPAIDTRAMIAAASEWHPVNAAAGEHTRAFSERIHTADMSFGRTEAIQQLRDFCLTRA
jgi:hypothetical protein